MRLTPGSGAGRMKGDARDSGGAYVEMKDANRSYTMSAEEFLTSWKRAVREGIECKWIIKFKNGITCRITVERDV